MSSFTIAIATKTTKNGAITENLLSLETAYKSTIGKADLLVFGELFLSGYGIQDLAKRPAFLDDIDEAVKNILSFATEDLVLGFGAPLREGDKIYIAYHYVRAGKIISTVRKNNLPNYEVFNEKRVFSPGAPPKPFEVNGVRLNTAICEDVWRSDYAQSISAEPFDILISPNASPYQRDKRALRENEVTKRAKELNCSVVYLANIALDDEVFFDGGAYVSNPSGEIVSNIAQFEEGINFQKFIISDGMILPEKNEITPVISSLETDYRVMVEAVRRYAQQTGFTRALVGLSGGIDSALVAAIAADALGPENLRTVMMPSQYTSQSSLDDANLSAKMVGAELNSISIISAVESISNELAPYFIGLPEDVTEENIQPRLRALYLMALSNKFSSLLLTTGNKSEVAVGYSTLYGDMAGGYNPLKDLYKTRLFSICEWRNKNHRQWMKGNEGIVIPKTIIEKPPSAELRPNQRDSDSLPPYEILDAILEAIIDDNHSVEEIITKGFDKETVLHVQKLVYLAEYKRFQAAPGVKLSKCGLGIDRRYPIINHWRDL